MRFLAPLTAVALIAAPAVVAAEATTAPAAAPAAAPAPAEKQICRSRLETGSLVKRKRTCLTAAQWRYHDEAHNRQAASIIQDNAGMPPAGP
jgi:hypothetical protein